MKPRSLLTSAELPALHEMLRQKLSDVGVQTQPEVALKVLDLVRRADAGMAEYAKVVRADAPLAGKFLKMANSAFFAQRDPVTSLDRACVLLGMERVRALALGFSLSHAAAGDPSRRLSREIWMQSIYRACLASELARRVLPERVSEAFVVGLMLDAGIPLADRLLGEPCRAVWETGLAPSPMFKREFAEHPFTHADVMYAMGVSWGLPELLLHPIAYHHTPPGDTKRTDGPVMMHRIAYYVGAIDLTPVKPEPREVPPLPSIAMRLFQFTSADVSSLVSAASREYQVAAGMFSKMAGTIQDMDALAASVHAQLVSVVDETIGKTLQPGGLKTAPSTFSVGESTIEIETSSTGSAVAYLLDASGSRVVSYRFTPRDETPDTLVHALGLDAPGQDDREVLAGVLKRLAA